MDKISLHTSAGMDWTYGCSSSFGQNELYNDFGELREEEVEELRSERTIKSGLKVRFKSTFLFYFTFPNNVLIFRNNNN